jgi:hypothetical protein
VVLVSAAAARGTNGGGERRLGLHWYNPKTREGEDVAPPTTDVEALEMLRGDINSGVFMAEYERLRAEEGMEIEQAMIFVGHEFRTRHLRYQPVG